MGSEEKNRRLAFTLKSSSAGVSHQDAVNRKALTYGLPSKPKTQNPNKLELLFTEAPETDSDKHNQKYYRGKDWNK